MKNQTTSPAKDLSKLGALLKVEDPRDRLLFACGLHMGLRGNSELCQLKWKDLLGERVQIFQPKTGKTRIFVIPDRLREIVAECYDGQDRDSYVFTGRRGQSGNSPLSNAGLNLILRRYFERFGIEFSGNNSSHALRKCFARSFVMANGNNIETLELLRRELNHSSINITMVYCGIETENHAKMVNKISYE